MYLKNKVFFLIAASLWLTAISSQEMDFKIPDSLKDMEYAAIYKAYKKVMNDTVKSLIYLKTYLEKGKRDGAKIKMARAYSLLSYYETDDYKRLKYLDSSIAISKNENDKFYPTVAYSFKGGFYFERGNYKRALSNYLSALDYAKKNKNEAYIYTTKHNIALLKYKIGKYEEAVSMFKEGLTYKKRRGIQDTLNYLTSVFSITYTYSKMKQIDSSSYYGKEGLLLAKQKSETIYYQFVLNEGINLYHKKNYVNAMDSIDKSLPFLKNLEDKSFLIDAYFYNGKINEVWKRTDEANAFYNKIDSVFRITKKYTSPEVRESYEALIRYYKTKQEQQQQLVYVERLLIFDSILRTNNEFLNEKLTKAYDTPELLAAQKSLIASINSKNESYRDMIKLLTVAVFLISGLFYYQYQRRKMFQKRFEILIHKKDNLSSDTIASDPDYKSGEDIAIANTLIEEVLHKIKKFEDNLEFLSQNILIRDIALKFNTNSRYLSNIINTYKKKSFTRYINDLRIDYTVDRLKNDAIFRKYSIRAIAEEVGFNTKGAFAESFYKRTGLKPFYFITRLKENDKTA